MPLEEPEDDEEYDEEIQRLGDLIEELTGERPATS